MTNEEILARVKKRLKQVGFTDISDGLEEDTSLVLEVAKLIYDEITLNINWDHIPEKLYSLYIDMICGEYLYNLYLFGRLGDYIPNKPSYSDINSIRAGDVTLGVKFGNTQGDNYLALIERLRNPRNKMYLLSIVRKSLE